jgi:hypothetical protein
MNDKLPQVLLKVIPHECQRYETVGDWHFTPNERVLNVRVSAMGDWRSEFAVGVHEAIEAMLCREHGVTDEVVTEFDMQFERERALGEHTPEAEPGDDLRAPYREEHVMATAVEQTVCTALGLSWEQHERNVYAL